MMRAIQFAAAVILGLAAIAQAQTKPARFIKEIEAFEAKDREAPPPKHGVLFVGSSSIRIWKTADAFPGPAVINRGFGGSEIHDSVEYFDRIIRPYDPKMIVSPPGNSESPPAKPPTPWPPGFNQRPEKIGTPRPG